MKRHHGGTGSLVKAVVGATWRVCEGGCSLQGPGTPAWGDTEPCPGGGWCVLQGLRGGCSHQGPGTPAWRTGSPTLVVVGAPRGPCEGAAVIKALSHQPGGQGVLPGRWSVCLEGPVRGASVFKAQAHHPGGPGSLFQAVVVASQRACEGGCSLQGPGTPSGGDKESCPGSGRCVVKGLRGGCSHQGPRTPALGGCGPAQVVAGAS